MARQGFAFPDNPHNTVRMFVSTSDADPFTETRLGIMRFLGIDPSKGHAVPRGRLDKSLLQALRVSTLSLPLSTSTPGWPTGTPCHW